MCLASLGHEVTLRDIDARKVAALHDGKIPIYEPGLEDLIVANRERLDFTLDLPRLLDRSEMIVIAVDTPPTYSGDADLSRVMGFVAELAALGGDPRHVLIMKSTVPVGTGERVRAELDAHGLSMVGYCSNPEFLKEGAAIDDFLHPDRVVIGEFRAEDGDRVAELYEPLGAPIIRTSVPTAEMVKYASNAFLATKISFINEIANVCEEVGADVVTVARGMGLDQRIGTAFLKAGIGFGGSCLLGDETVLARIDGVVRLLQLDELFVQLAPDAGDGPVVVHPRNLEVLAWEDGWAQAEFMSVSVATRRPYDGEVFDVRTKMGRRVRVTADHPFVARSGAPDVGSEILLARDLGTTDWLPVAQGMTSNQLHTGIPVGRILDALPAADLADDDVRVRVGAARLAEVGRVAVRRVMAGMHPEQNPSLRTHDVMRNGTVRLPELSELGMPVDAAMFLGTAKNGTYVPAEIPMDDQFWRVVGLYLAEGHCTVDGDRHRLFWSFHPYDEHDLVDEVAGYWTDLGVKATVRRGPTACSVSVSSRLLANWWLHVLGLGTNAYRQRVPDLIWTESETAKFALLSGAWHGDGSCSVVRGGPSAVLEYGTISRELADGLLRLLGDVQVMARLKVGRTALSTKDTYWIVISGAHQIERVQDFIKRPKRDAILASIARQAKRIAPTGYRRVEASTAWVRVTETRSEDYSGPVYSLEVPGAGTFVTTAGLIVHNCFPKDVSALKQLAGNSGYHFQLLNSVIEVNELQKRRVIGKLRKHVGALEGSTIALLGLAFKPETDDMREASSLVLAARLLAEGATVRAWDPIAMEAAGDRLRGVDLSASAAEAMRGADAVVLVTEWRQIIDLDWATLAPTMNRAIVIDGRNALDPAAMREHGFTYEGIGRA